MFSSWLFPNFLKKNLGLYEFVAVVCCLLENLKGSLFYHRFSSFYRMFYYLFSFIIQYLIDIFPIIQTLLWYLLGNMYLQEIIIDGFKSYAQKTVISGFDPQFNAITGLNGTGKSNILDAICFVLGIQNLTQVCRW